MEKNNKIKVYRQTPIQGDVFWCEGFFIPMDEYDDDISDSRIRKNRPVYILSINNKTNKCLVCPITTSDLEIPGKVKLPPWCDKEEFVVTTQIYTMDTFYLKRLICTIVDFDTKYQIASKIMENIIPFSEGDYDDTKTHTTSFNSGNIRMKQKSEPKVKKEEKPIVVPVEVSEEEIINNIYRFLDSKDKRKQYYRNDSVLSDFLNIHQIVKLNKMFTESNTIKEFCDKINISVQTYYNKIKPELDTLVLNTL